MAFIRIKTVKGIKYYYLVESVREGGKVRQKILQYFGTTPPEGYVVPTREARPVVAKEAIKKAGTTKTMDKVVPGVVLTDKSHIYYLGCSVPDSIGYRQQKMFKNFGTTLPSDTDIVAAIGTTPIPKNTGYYLVERSVRGKETIVKSSYEIARIVSTTPLLPLESVSTTAWYGFVPSEFRQEMLRRAKLLNVSVEEWAFRQAVIRLRNKLTTEATKRRHKQK